MISFRRWAEVRCSSTITGASSSPKRFAASRRPCPAMMTPSSPTRMGLTKPNSAIEAAICAICQSGCVLGLRAKGSIRSRGIISTCKAKISDQGPTKGACPGEGGEPGAPRQAVPQRQPQAFDPATRAGWSRGNRKQATDLLATDPKQMRPRRPFPEKWLGRGADDAPCPTPKGRMTHAETGAATVATRQRQPDPGNPEFSFNTSGLAGVRPPHTVWPGRTRNRGGRQAREPPRGSDSATRATPIMPQGMARIGRFVAP